ncbi:Lrp/AsnC ligand binding domain-containing protein [Promethearchaeum syntrophicum]|uniref:Lrp/AsnC ligand binding domain-containing protein n=1 Tax=Promethearchaeum syntrophicum TaxID=2594042 RepID=A0A5B9DA93_9ARCH|nr:Lrp/AsnC ligand binding domain-containing protein [Candidatus Prometheoarchaeum syntrophicum]QEE15670.1 AsnC family protein [Candidatus Prometheoarchaeum syntrophicum]
MAGKSSISKRIAILGLSNILWGLIPWPASNLFKDYSSLLIIFTRFMFMSFFLLLIVGILLIIDRIKVKDKNKSINLRKLIQYLKSRNYEFFKFPQWAYLLIVGIFGLNSMTILFFLALKTIGVITTSIGVLTSLVIVTAINWGRGKEEMTKFKVLYLTTLIGATFILGYISQVYSISESSVSFGSIVLVLIYGIALSFFVITGSTDKMSLNEFKIVKENPRYQLIRTFFKLGMLGFFSALVYIPSLFLMSKFHFNEQIDSEITLFFTHLSDWWKIALNFDGIILIIVCTLIPYVIYYIMAANWPKHTSFNLWVGVMQLIEPLINIIIGITLLNEVFPLSWLLIIIFLFGIAIFTRYLSETETQIFAIFLLKIKPQFQLAAMQKAFTIKPVKEVSHMIGDYDIFLDTQLHSSQALNKFIQQDILTLPGLIRYDFLIITNNILEKD